MPFRPAIGPTVPRREWEDLSWMELEGAEDDPRRKTVIQEAAQINGVIRRLLAAGTAEFRGSPLVVADAPLTFVGPGDIERIQRVRLSTAPMTSANNRLHAHLEIAGLYGKHLGLAVSRAGSNVLPHALQAAGELNDVGKLTGVFRYHFNDVVGDAILDDLRIHPGVRNLFMPTEFHVGPVSYAQAKKMQPDERDGWVAEYCGDIYDALTLEQKIFIYADVCGKPAGAAMDDIQTFEGMRETHLRTRGSAAAYLQYIGAKVPVWPSEIYGVNHIEGFADGWMGIYERIKAEFEGMGVDLEAVRIRVRDEWRSSGGPGRHAAV